MEHPGKNKRKQFSPRASQDLSEQLQKDLCGYALFAAAAGVAVLACATVADAAPMCTYSTTVLTVNHSFPLNPAGQDIAPFNFAETFIEISSHSSDAWNRGFLTPNLPKASVLLDAHQLPAALDTGASIGPGGNFGQGRSYGLLFSYGPLGGGTRTRHHGNIAFGQDTYLGFEFSISGKTHFGWTKIRVNLGNGLFPTLHILEYAYETEPATAILAGSCSNAEAHAPQPTSLGALALGAKGIPLWRKVND